MDRALKERIIGAIVLVAIVVLVVPVFLDGPAPADEEIISQPVLLPGQTREAGERRTVVLQRDREQPLPGGSAQDATHPVDAAAEASTRPEPVTTPAPVESGGPRSEDPPEVEDDAGDDAGNDAVAAAATPEPEESRPANEEPADAPAEPASRPEPAEAESTTGMWAVQIGSFSNKDNADRLAAKLREEGYAAFLSQHRGPSGELHRVRIGPQEDRPSAEAVAQRLSDEGFKGQVVPHP